MNKPFFATIDKPLGYDKILEDLAKQINLNKFHPISLLTGDKGVGKRMICDYLAKEIIGESLNKFSDISYHPDILIIESLKENIKKEIIIEQIREIKNFVSLTPSQAKNKLIIIDAIDQLNINSANAILKLLEEPNPNIYFLLVNHKIEILLDTIKSRCNKILIPRLSKEDFFTILANKKIDSDQELLYDIFAAKPGQAIVFYENKGLEMLNLLNCFFNKEVIINKQILSDKFDFKNNPNSFRCFLPIVNYLISREIRKNNLDGLRIEKLANFISEFNAEYYKSIAVNMDNYNFILTNLFKIEKIL